MWSQSIIKQRFPILEATQASALLESGQVVGNSAGKRGGGALVSIKSKDFLRSYKYVNRGVK
jgi:hypothetical protein